MRIAVDGFGGDYAPDEIVKGSLQAAEMYNVHIALVGDKQILTPMIGSQPGSHLVEVVHATERIEMDESPVEAVRQKRDSSLMVAARLVRDGEADALVSAGSTGAAMAASVLGIGRLKGIERPAITSLMPTLRGVCLIADVGANVDCRPKHLVQFAQMGSIYAAKVLERSNPKVALLSVGEEPTKGNELTIKTHEQLRTADLNFIGNVEGRDIPKGEADVVVCDGFVGNIVLKLAEGLGSALFGMLRDEFTKSTAAKLGALFLKPGLRTIKRRMDYTEYGGAPLLGLKGMTIIAHGSSNAKAIRNAVRVAKEAVEAKVVELIAQMTVGDEG